MSKIFEAIGLGVFCTVVLPPAIIGGILASPFLFAGNYIEKRERANDGIIGFDNQHLAEKYIKNNKYTPLVLQYSNKKLSDLDFGKSSSWSQPGFDKFQFSKLLRELNSDDKNAYTGYSYDTHMNVFNEHIKDEGNMNEYLKLHENMVAENKKIKDRVFTDLELAKLIEHQKYGIQYNLFHRPYYYTPLKFIKTNQHKTHYEKDE